MVRDRKKGSGVRNDKSLGLIHSLNGVKNGVLMEIMGILDGCLFSDDAISKGGVSSFPSSEPKPSTPSVLTHGGAIADAREALGTDESFARSPNE